jgi:2-polyprenyl-6-hydroxyphenyl methylase/3-demethylubiquinone-9 3-methyltransferase
MPDNRPAAVGDPDRSAFDDNWRRFVETLDHQRIKEAETSLQMLLGRSRLDGLTLLEVGSGNCLFSLAARGLGATVHSFDRDPDSVDCGVELRRRYFPGDPRWTVERGSILDARYVADLDRFDVVYSWGVLSHTGAMGEAIRNAAMLVKPGGQLVLALHGKTLLCRPWTHIKRWYAAADPQVQRRARECYIRLVRLAFKVARRDFESHVTQYRSKRGLDFEHDLHDWMRGYPFESIRPKAVDKRMANFGFEPVRTNTRGYSIGLFATECDEYVYQRA